MIRKTLFAAALFTGTMIASTAPANALTFTWWHTHYCDCGHSGSGCGTTSGGTTSSTTSGGTTTTSGGTTTTSGGTTTTTSGGTTTSTSGGSTSGGTDVPEPGMLGMLGMGLLGLAYARRRKTRA